MPGTPLRRGNKPCGAFARSTGQACRNTATYPNGRCKNHGGLAKGPTSEAGKAIALRNLFERRGPQTPEGRERILEALKRGLETQRRNRMQKLLERQSKGLAHRYAPT